MITHTPGPWAKSRDAVPDDHVQVTVYAEGNGRRVATVFEDEGNGDLVAAAPDLLAAMTLILDRLATSPMQDDELAATIRAAIAKAKGL